MDAVFAALSDPTRRQIVARLTSGDATVGALAEPFTMTMQAVSQHLKVLEKAGLVSRSRFQQTRPCRLEVEALDEALGWLGDARQEWAARTDRLDAHLRTLADRSSDRDSDAEQP